MSEVCRITDATDDDDVCQRVGGCGSSLLGLETPGTSLALNPEVALSQIDPDRRHQFLRRRDTNTSGGGRTRGSGVKVVSLSKRVDIWHTNLLDRN